MTVSEVLTAAKNKYNAIGDTFFSDAELLTLLYEACQKINKTAKIIEATYTTSTVASQQEYAYPSNTLEIKRITYNGRKLEPISMIEDDLLTGHNQSTTSTGTPATYFVWNETISLRPIPDSVGTLKIYSFNEPSVLTINSAIEVPTLFHMDLVNFMVSEMAAKDKQWEHARFYLDKFNVACVEALQYSRKKQRGDAMPVVQTEESKGYLVRI